MERRYDDDFIPFSLFWWMRMMMRMMMERGNNLVDDLLSRERRFSWRQRRQHLDTIGFLNMPPLFLIIIFFSFIIPSTSI